MNVSIKKQSGKKVDEPTLYLPELNKRIIILVTLLLMFTSGAKAQFLWNMTHTYFDTAHYAFTSLSCSGDNCTAGGLEIRTSPDGRVFIVLWRSNDGGSTWEKQDPQLPYELGQNQNQLSNIQQIDSLNVVAIGDSGLIVRTFDGGVTWQRQDCNSTFMLHDVHFSDSLTGIIVSDGLMPIHTTTDGGRHWVDAPYHNSVTSTSKQFLSQCHSYGGGKFRTYREYLGPIYTTTDNWKTIDSTNLLIDTVLHKSYTWYHYTHCNFTDGDTMIAFGVVYYNGTINNSLIMKTTDAGASWSNPVNYNGPQGEITTMTSLDRDTILAGSQGASQYLLSTDRGLTWNNETYKLQNSNYQLNWSTGLCWSNRDHLVGAYQNVPFRGNSGILISGDRVTNRVEMYENIVWNTRIYPNPAANAISIICPDASRPIHIKDMLGREVLRSQLSEKGTVKLDIENLRDGIYDVLIDHYGRMIPIGKVAVIQR